MLTVKMAWRNIFRQKRRTILTVLTMIGGFGLSALSIGWADGTYNRIINVFTRQALGHIQIHKGDYLDRPSIYTRIEDYPRIDKAIAPISGIEAWSPRLYAAGLASVDDKSAGVRIVGVDPVRETEATRFDKKIIKGRSLSREAAHEVIPAKNLARTLKADVGDELVIISQGADGSIANDLYTVVGILESGDAATDQVSLFMHLHEAQELLVLGDDIHEVVIIVDKLSKVLPIADEIRQALDDPSLQVAPWQEFARSFYVAMKADKQGAWIMLFIIILIVAIGVLNTVLMTVLERRREYGVLRAVGTSPLQIFSLVLYEAALMAGIGIILGFCLSLPVNYWFSIHGLAMPQTFTYGGMEFSRYYSEINAHSFYIPAVTVVLSAVLISIFPAVKAARVPPARALRMH